MFPGVRAANDESAQPLQVDERTNDLRVERSIVFHQIDCRSV